MKKRTVSTFIRKRLGLKGATEHNGRGLYECDVNGVPQSKLASHLGTAARGWLQDGFVTSILETSEELRVTFNDTFDENYFTLVVPNPGSPEDGSEPVGDSVFYVPFALHR